MKKILLLLAVLVLTGATFWWINRNGEGGGSAYRFVEIEQGDLEAVVSATGMLEPVTTVEVGTQVSGRIDRILVDFNDEVRQGQVIATIDATLLRNAVSEAEANLERNLAQLEQAKREHERMQGLFEKQFVTEVEFNQVKYELDIAQATVKSAQISLSRARQNLAYATIYAPISGTVIERNVEVGQTVAASLSAPVLFRIANDLSKMQILASVDESDIGSIREGQDVRFTVQAYPDDTFLGAVRQVRLQSTMQENVVNYSVVVDVQNDDGRLLPGMTATLDFILETAENVLKVSNAALRFRPTPAMMEVVRERFRQQREARMEQMPDSVRQRIEERRAARGGEGGQRGEGEQAGNRSRGAVGQDGGGGGFAGGVGGGRGGGRGNGTMLWYLDETGQVGAMRVRTGITDGQSTEVIPLRGELEPGMEVIAGVSSASSSSSGTNPFQSQNTPRRRGGSF